MSTPNLEQIAREMAEKLVPDLMLAGEYVALKLCSRDVAKECYKADVAKTASLILAALRQVAPQPAKTEEVRRAISAAIDATNNPPYFDRLPKWSEARGELENRLLAALTPYLRADREPCRDTGRLKDEKWDMDKLAEFYHNGDGQWVVDFLLDHVLSEFNKALGGKGWDAYESDGGIDEAISYEINTLLEKNQAINEWDHRPLGPLLVALCSLTDKESKKGKWRVTLDYDNYQDGGRVLDGDGRVLGECYEDRGHSDEGEGANGQLVAAIIAAIDAAASANEGKQL